MKKWFLIFILLSTVSFAQSYKWEALVNAPVAARHDGMAWVTPEKGWIINSSGQIWKTTDGGNSWVQQKAISSYLRSIDFADSLHGWVGTLRGFGLANKSLIQPLYFTSDGGTNWTKLDTTLIPSPKPTKICGLSMVGTNIIYGSGGYDGPARIVKSIDGGATWTSIDMSPYAQTLIDIKFFSADTGIVVGGGLSGVFGFDVGSNTINAVVLYTTDGGATWTPKYTGSVAGEWGWKIDFLTRNIGYVSLEAFEHATILKTTDGGLTWSRMEIENNFDLEGVGFINENHGFAGGYGITTETVNGGETWTALNISGAETEPVADEHRVNRFKFFGDTLGYASGRTIYKYQKVVALPVEMTTFTVSQKDEQVFLNWSVVSEINNAGFSVERRINSGIWETLAFVPGRGTTTSAFHYSYTDQIGNKKFNTIEYRLKQTDLDGKFTYGKIESIGNNQILSKSPLLLNNYPNPFNPSTAISYKLQSQEDVKITIYNSFGQEVRVLFEGKQNPGIQTMVLDGKISNGSSASSGTYYYRVDAGKFSESKGMTLIK